ncbi:DUF6159 family protein [Baekduia sp. Peel2402]|uniref:DUF6159 family protein n=1 Tax=Baekduia sp. Peel2402 TaxID=3458296 RepID=UPI00403EE9D8
MIEGSNHSEAVPEGRWERSLFFLDHVWELFRGDRALIAVAAVGTVLNVAAAAVIFGLAEWLVGDAGMRAFTAVSLAAIALPSTIVSTFCNVALVRMAQARFEGRHCTARQGFAAARTRWRPILAWSLLSVGVGAVLDWIAEKLPFGGALASWLLGAAWSLGTMFAIPVMALEDAGARRAAKRSVELFRARWGESLGGQVSVGFISFMAAIPGGLLLVGGLSLGGTTGVALAAGGGALLMASITVTRALEELFALAVYRFETAGAASFGLEPSQLDAFVNLKHRRGSD